MDKEKYKRVLEQKEHIITTLCRQIQEEQRIIASKNETISINEETIKTMQGHIENLQGCWEQSRKKCDELRQQIYGIKEPEILTDGLIDTPELQILNDYKRFHWIVGEA